MSHFCTSAEVSGEGGLRSVRRCPYGIRDERSHFAHAEDAAECFHRGRDGGGVSGGELVDHRRARDPGCRCGIGARCLRAERRGREDLIPARLGRRRTDQDRGDQLHRRRRLRVSSENINIYLVLYRYNIIKD